MSAIEEIHQLPLHEKIRIMEALWDDLSREEAQLEVPQWHKDLLDEREQLLAEGKTKLIDWDEAKQQIRKAVQ